MTVYRYQRHILEEEDCKPDERSAMGGQGALFSRGAALESAFFSGRYTDEDLPFSNSGRDGGIRRHDLTGRAPRTGSASQHKQTSPPYFTQAAAPPDQGRHHYAAHE